ncbi:MAG: BON domain-containing protein, partial [Gemmataceae bacterium]
MSLTPLIRLLLIGCSLSAMLQAAEPPLARSSSGFDDAKLALKVKSAIAADPEIGGINVFVSVLDGVVAVQGPVESAAVKEKLQKLVSTVPGVATVKVDCFVLAAEDTLKKEVAKRLAPVPSGETASAAAAAAATTPEPKISVPQGTGSLPSIAVGPPTLTANVPTTSDDLPPLNGSKSTVTVQRPSDSIEPMRPLLPGELLAAPVSAKPTATASKSSTDIPAAK